MATRIDVNPITNDAVTTGPLPSSRKVHVPAETNPSIKVAMREVDLDPHSGEEPVRIYDPSGPFTDPAVSVDITEGLAPLRRQWILARNDVEEYAERVRTPQDDGLKPDEALQVPVFDRRGRTVLRAKPGKCVTQLEYARTGIITPEMEYIAARENLGREEALRKGAATRDRGEGFGVD